jgi:hypothetical protein
VTDEQFHAILSELRAIHAVLRRRNATAAPALIVAIEDYFGEGSFTVSGLLALADDDPHGAIADALADVVNMNASPRSRATALGVLLSRLTEIEIVTQQRGFAVYRLRT